MGGGRLRLPAQLSASWVEAVWRARTWRLARWMYGRYVMFGHVMLSRTHDIRIKLVKRHKRVEVGTTIVLL